MAKIDLCYEVIDWAKRKPDQDDDDAPKKEQYPTLSLPSAIEGLEKLQPGKHTLTIEVNIDKRTEEDADGEKDVSIDMDVLSIDIPEGMKRNSDGKDDSEDEIEENLRMAEAENKAYPAKKSKKKEAEEEDPEEEDDKEED